MNILIIRLSAIGDIVMASGLIPALRRQSPNAHISWLAEPAGATLLQANPRLDEVLVWPRDDWRRLRKQRRYGQLSRAVCDFARDLRERRFDLALDTQGLLKSGIWAWLTRAPRRIGLGSREGSERLMTEVLEPLPHDSRIGSEYRQLAAHLGADGDTFPMDLEVTEQDRQTALAALTAQDVTGAYVVLCPFTTRPQKHWFDERWQALGKRVHREMGLQPVILGGPGDNEHAAQLAAGLKAPKANLTGQLSLRQSVAAVRGAAALVGVDTGLTHMGTACGIPTVALFGSTCPYLQTDCPTTRVLYEPLWCSPCRRNPICGGVHSCMRLHRSDRVFEILRSLLEPTL